MKHGEKLWNKEITCQLAARFEFALTPIHCSSTQPDLDKFRKAGFFDGKHCSIIRFWSINSICSINFADCASVNGIIREYNSLVDASPLLK